MTTLNYMLADSPDNGKKDDERGTHSSELAGRKLRVAVGGCSRMSEKDADSEDDPLLAEETQAFNEDELSPVADDDAFEEMEGEFEEMSADGTDGDEVWADVTDETDESSTGIVQESADSAEITAADAPDVAEVSKHDYCERCEFFSGPPEIHCTNEGTEILEFTDMNTVRVANCPIVAERRGLEEGVTTGREIDRSE